MPLRAQLTLFLDSPDCVSTAPLNERTHYASFVRSAAVPFFPNTNRPHRLNTLRSHRSSAVPADVVFLLRTIMIMILPTHGACTLVAALRVERLRLISGGTAAKGRSQWHPSPRSRVTVVVASPWTASATQFRAPTWRGLSIRCRQMRAGQCTWQPVKAISPPHSTCSARPRQPTSHAHPPRLPPHRCPYIHTRNEGVTQ
jgi:hypothetical protein